MFFSTPTIIYIIMILLVIIALITKKSEINITNQNNTGNKKIEKRTKIFFLLNFIIFSLVIFINYNNNQQFKKENTELYNLIQSELIKKENK